MRLLILIMTVVILQGCGATVPLYKVSSPWIRSFQLQEKLSLGMTVSTKVKGNTEPLLGEEVLLESRLESILDQLLMRRGFIVEDQSGEVDVVLDYHTERVDKLDITTTQSTSSLSFQSVASGSGVSATGVTIAATVARLADLSASSTSQQVTSNTGFIHTISLEIRNKAGKFIWKSESTWDSPTLDIENEIFSVLQILLSELPTDETVFPRVAELKESHLLNYFKSYCADVWFKCPALPYRIYFQHSTDYKYRIVWKSLKHLEDPKALPAYVDMVRTAEFALPLGKKEYDDPTNLELWKKAMLGSQYYIGSSTKPQNILIELHGESSGYVVNRCWVATDEEFEQFEERMKRWKDALTNYFDMYVN